MTIRHGPCPKHKGMNEMKKTTAALLLFLALALLLSGCQPTPAPEATQAPAAATQAPPAETAAQIVEETAEPAAEAPAGGSVMLYEGPGLLASSPRLTVNVEGREAFVYETPVNHQREFSFNDPAGLAGVVIFDTEGSADITVSVAGATELSEVKVTPLGYGITPAVAGNTISFTILGPGNYTVEYADGSGKPAHENALHIFANPPEKDPLSADSLPENTIFFGPGVYVAGAIPVSADNTTIYLSGGAVVYGNIVAGGFKGLSIRGRGILSGDLFERKNAAQFTLPIELQKMEGVTIEGIAILNPAGWAITLGHCRDVLLDNVKIITSRANGDGVSVQSSQNVLMDGGFVRSWDDSLVVKNVQLGSTENVVFDGVTVWTDLAQSCEVGYETHGESMRDITFKNITVLHNFHKAALSIHNADQAKISGVTYENITIEDAAMRGDNQLDGENDLFIDLVIAFNREWSKSGGERGSVSDIAFRNIKVLKMADTIVSRLVGESEASAISGVTFQNIEIAGQQAGSAEALKLMQGAYVSCVTFVNDGPATGAELPSFVPKAGPAEVRVVPTKAQQGPEVPAFAIVAAEKGYVGAKIEAGIKTRLSFGSGDKAASKWNLAPGAGEGLAALTDGDEATLWALPAWSGQEEEFAALSFDFDHPSQVGTIRLTGAQDENTMRYYRLSVFAKKKADAEGKETWVRQLFSEDYGVSPQNGNYVDIKLAPGEYYGLQLRLFKMDRMMYPELPELAEIAFYPPSLTTGKAIVDVSEYEDVYDSGKLLDGDNATYFEGKKGLFPAHLAVDMGEAAPVRHIAIHLPPLLSWNQRTQTIEILGSMDGKTYTTALPAAQYKFDAKTGNYLTLSLAEAVPMRFIKLVFTSNSSGYGAQISELYVFAE